jgi:hypothetical protein
MRGADAEKVRESAGIKIPFPVHDARPPGPPPAAAPPAAAAQGA